MYALLLLLACASPRPTPGAVAADHPLASEAGAQVLRRGGNAVDAAVAAALAGGVVQPQSSGLGGGGFAVVVAPGKDPVALDFREVAPSTATAGMFLDGEGRPIPGASEHGPLAVAVPGEPRGLAELLRRFGSLTPQEVAAPAIALARDGFPVGESLARASASWSREHGDQLFPLLFDGVDHPPREGERVRRTRLAATLERWAAGGGDFPMEGPFPASDRDAYRVVVRAPLVGTWRGLTLVTMPPPSSGGVVILQALRALEAWPPAADPMDPADVGRAVEALQHGFADRARWMGDPDFVDVPVERLLSDEHVEAVRAAMRSVGAPPACRTLEPGAYGLPLDGALDGGTHHISAMDGGGVAVALTTTINTHFGSGVVDPVSGVLLNDEMDDFVVAPGVANAFGLVGNARNAVAPGKRPLSSMSPTLVLDGQGQPSLSLGASGGPRIITGTLEVTRAVLEAGLSPEAALDLPRYHHQWSPPTLFVEPQVPAATRQALQSCGHRVEERGPENAVQVVQRLPDGTFRAASDPRKGGRAVVVP